MTPDPTPPEPIAVRSPDGTSIAMFRMGDPSGRPLVLIHGTTADHTTFRAIGPRLADAYDLYAIDRRGRMGVPRGERPARAT